MPKRKSSHVNPRLLHDDVLSLIKDEIDTIKRTEGPKYPPEVSLLLVRYSQALSAVTKDYDDQKAREAERLGKLTPEELKERALELTRRLSLSEQGL